MDIRTIEFIQNSISHFQENLKFALGPQPFDWQEAELGNLYYLVNTLWLELQHQKADRPRRPHAAKEVTD